MMHRLYVISLIVIGVAIVITISIISITIDLILIKSERVINNINPDQTLNDLINGTITDKIIDEINTLAKQD